MKHLPLPVSFLIIALFFNIAAAAPRQDEPPAGQQTADRWYVVMLAGQRAGYMREQAYDDGEQITSLMQMQMSVKRGQMEMSIAMDQRFVETVAGDPVEAVTTIAMGAQPIVTLAMFYDDRIEVSNSLIPAAQNRAAAKEGYLPPAALGRYIEQQLAAGAQRIVYRTIEVATDVQFLESTSTIVGHENIIVMGKVVPATVWDTTTSLMPSVVMREYVDDKGHKLKASLNLLPGMEMEFLAADEALAMSPLNPLEVMSASLLRPDKPIDQPRQLRAAIYQVTIDRKEGSPPVDLPRGGSQRIVWASDKTASVVVNLDEPVNPIDDLPKEELLAASIMLNHEDLKVRELVAQALGDNSASLSDMEKADQLRNFVEQYIDEKDLSVGFATASEVARTSQGDCTEHAVLLAAMLRAADIPSRTVSGLMYVDQFLGEVGVFGYHMWAQAWLDDDTHQRGRWVDFDGVLQGRRFDAAHIALMVSSMSQTSMTNDLVALVPLMGILKIKIVETKR